MERLGTSRTTLRATICVLSLLGGCSISDYSDEITSFSTAVGKANTAEQSLMTFTRQNDLSNQIDRAGKGTLSYSPPDLVKCLGSPGPYKAGDCVVKLGGQPAPAAAETPSFASMVKYAAALSAVTADKTCASLDTDAKGLSTAIADIATDTGNKSVAAPAGALETIVTTGGCLIIETMQLNILRTATKAANPIIAKEVALATDKDTALQTNATTAAWKQLTFAVSRYNATKSAADLKQVVALSEAVDQAQLAQLTPLGKSVQALADMHQALTTDLDSPTVNLKRFQNDAQAFITSASAVEAAATTLANPTPTTPAKATK